MSLDLSLFNIIYGAAHRYAVLESLALFSAKYLVYVLAALFILFILFKYGSHKRLYLLCLGSLAVIFSRGIITELICFFYCRPSPFAELNLPLIDYSASGSLLSGHMMFLAPLALLVWHEDRSWGKWFIALTLLVGIGRIAVGFHWPTDILLGAMVGGAIFYLVRKFLPKPRS